MSGFWKWYLGVLKHVLSFKWVLAPECEIFLSLVAAVAGLVLCIIYLWTLLLIPPGITAAAHGYWRQHKKGDE